MVLSIEVTDTVYDKGLQTPGTVYNLMLSVGYRSPNRTHTLSIRTGTSLPFKSSTDVTPCVELVP